MDNLFYNQLKEIPFSESVYISGYFALNIHSPESTGDWHKLNYWYDESELGRTHLLGLEGFSLFETGSYFGGDGVFVANEIMIDMGLGRFCEGIDIYMANHHRAVCDFVIRYAIDGEFYPMTDFDDMLPADEDKPPVYVMLEKGLPKMPPNIANTVKKWIAEAKNYNGY